MKRSTLFSLISIFVLIPATLYLGTQMSGRSYYLTGGLIIVETMIPFFLRFEARRPQVRELVTIAVLSALAAVSRAAFAFLPNFKPLVAIVMIAGIAYGGEVGFLTGAISGFASNFMFGQGPWTPWQMLAYGMGGFLAGIVFHRTYRNQTPLKNALLLPLFCFGCVLCVVGPILDLCTLFTTGSTITPAFAGAVFSLGLPFNAIHGVSCGITILLFGKPLLAKLDRLKKKYGLLE